MNLISCENCGVVLDLSRIEMPDIWDEEGDSVNTEIAHLGLWGLCTHHRVPCL